MGFSPISISLSPNVEKNDALLCLKLVFQPWKWKKGKETKELENKFKDYLGVKYAYSFNSGRTAQLAILKSLDLESDDEVMLQAFTCNAAINPVFWAGLKVKYIDCDKNDFNIDLKDLKKKARKNSKVLMVQHTFGMPADMDKLKDFNMILIEDCAHSLGGEYKGKKVGTFGKASFFSFSRDKIISSVYGGIAATNDKELAEKIENYRNNIKYPSYFWIFQQLIHPILLRYFILPVYNFINLGKIFLVLSQNFHILSKAVHKKEKKGIIPPYFPKKMPNALCILALNQFKKLDRFNRHRKKIAEYYYNELKNAGFSLPMEFKERKSAFLRFTIKSDKAHSIIYDAWKKNNILVGDWYTSPIAPIDTDLKRMGYKKGMCKNAEELSEMTFNLPTHINISLKEAKRIVDLLKKHGNKRNKR